MKKVVLKTALKTLLAVIIALLLAFTIASLGFPRGMAGMCENTGNYSMAIGYSSLSYKYTGEIGDLARCAENSILAENDKKIIKYCEQLAAHKDFEKFCEEKSGTLALGNLQFEVDYKQFIIDSLNSAKARSNK